MTKITILPIKVKIHFGELVDIQPDGDPITESEINRAIFAMRRLIMQKRSYGVIVE